MPFLAGTATGLTIGGAEMLGSVWLIAATARVSIYQRHSWWRWNERFIRVRSLRDVRLTPGEALLLALGVVDRVVPERADQVSFSTHSRLRTRRGGAFSGCASHSKSGTRPTS